MLSRFVDTPYHWYNYLQSSAVNINANGIGSVDLPRHLESIYFPLAEKYFDANESHALKDEQTSLEK